MRAASITTALPAALSTAPSRRDPGIEMGAGHHIAGARDRAGNVGEDVVGVRVLVVEADVAHQLERRRRVGAGEAGEAAIILGAISKPGRRGVRPAW
jgi:hypothetical protein